MGKYQDLAKVERTLESCESVEQVEVAKKMFKCWAKKYRVLKFACGAGLCIKNHEYHYFFEKASKKRSAIARKQGW